MWGSNKDGRLGHSSTDITSIYEIPQLRFTAVALGSHHTTAITEDGEVYGWGRNTSAQLGDAADIVSVPTRIAVKAKIVKVAAGWGHTLLLDSDAVAYSFGCNDNGQLGHGNR